MAGLVLDGQRVRPVLDEVGDIEAAQRMEVQPGGQPELVTVGRTACSARDPDPLPRSDGHNAGEAVALANSGRASLIHCSSTPGSQGQTVSTPRRFGADPLPALPNRTRHRPNSPNSAACGLVPRSARSSIWASVRRSPNP